MESNNSQQFLKAFQSYASQVEARRGRITEAGQRFNTDNIQQLFQTQLLKSDAMRERAEATAALAGALGAAPGAIQGLKKAGESGAKLLEERFPETYENLDRATQGIRSGLREVGGALREGLGELGEETAAGVRSAGDTLAQIGGTARDVGRTVGRSALQTLQRAGNASAENLGRAGSSALEGVSRAGSNSYEGISRAARLTRVGARGLARGTAQNIDEASQNLRSAGNVVAEDVSRMTRRGLSEATSSTRDMARDAIRGTRSAGRSALNTLRSVGRGTTPSEPEPLDTTTARPAGAAQELGTDDDMGTGTSRFMDDAPRFGRSVANIQDSVPTNITNEAPSAVGDVEMVEQPGFATRPSLMERFADPGGRIKMQFSRMPDANPAVNMTQEQQLGADTELRVLGRPGPTSRIPSARPVIDEYTGIQDESVRPVSQALPQAEAPSAAPVAEPDQAASAAQEGRQLSTIQEGEEGMQEGITPEAGEAAAEAGAEAGGEAAGEAAGVAGAEAAEVAGATIASTALDFLGPVGILAGIVTAGVELGKALKHKTPDPVQQQDVNIRPSAFGRMKENIAPSINTALTVGGGISAF